MGAATEEGVSLPTRRRSAAPWGRLPIRHQARVGGTDVQSTTNYGLYQ